VARLGRGFPSKPQIIHGLAASPPPILSRVQSRPIVAESERVFPFKPQIIHGLTSASPPPPPPYTAAPLIPALSHFPNVFYLLTHHEIPGTQQAFVPPPSPPAIGGSFNPSIAALAHAPGVFFFTSHHEAPGTVQAPPATITGTQEQAFIPAYSPFWRIVKASPGQSGAGGTYSPPAPPQPPSPVSPAAMQLLPRLPAQAQIDDRLKLIANQLSAAWNSLVMQGILRLTGPGAYTIQLNSIDYFAANSSHWLSGSPPATLAAAIDRIAAWIAAQGGSLP
jgi:hypothetical protein